MKFTHGYWLKREGVTAHHPAEVETVEVGDGKLTLYVPCRPIRGRGDTLDGALLTVTLWSPCADVIGVRATHHVGGIDRRPSYGLAIDAHHVAGPYVAAEQAGLTSGRLSARVNRGGPWALSFEAEGRPLTRSGWRGLGAVEVAGHGRFMHEQLGLSVGELVYGLGERFTPFVKNGQVVDIWNEDGGTSSEHAYKNIPFYLTNNGYGVFVNHPERVSFEVASENVSAVQFSVPGQTLEYFVIYGPTPKEVLRKYTALTGRAALPPAWSFGLWLSTSFTTPYDEATITSFIQGMQDRDLPLSVFHFDCFWMKQFHWCDFCWDEAAFPDPVGMLDRLHARGLKVCVWINPYIAQRSPLFAEGAAAGYLLKRADGSIWQTDKWQAGMGIVDFTNPAARDWYRSKLSVLLDQGVDAFKTDFGERIPTDVVYHDGSDPQRMHNFYSLLYNQTVFELLETRRGVGEAVVFARSATAGGQRFPVHWGGDCESTFEAMAQSLRGGLSLGLSGFGFWSHDIGGFEGLPQAGLYKRWLAFGLLSSHSRLHGSSSYRVPWLFDEEAVDVLRHFTRLKHRLMPYLFAAAREAHLEGLPVMRALALEFPGDPACEALDRQYMLGGSLLVAPVFSSADAVRYYVPAGRWTSILSGAVVTGPGWFTEAHGFQSLPLLARPNSIIAFGAEAGRPDYEFAQGLTLRVYELADGATATAVIPTVTGDEAARFTVTRVGRTISVDRVGATGEWRVLLVNIPAIVGVEGGRAELDSAGVILTAPAAGARLRIMLD